MIDAPTVQPRAFSTWSFLSFERLVTIHAIERFDMICFPIPSSALVVPWIIGTRLFNNEYAWGSRQRRNCQSRAERFPAVNANLATISHDAIQNNSEAMNATGDKPFLSLK
jgi:hypothetical protein